MLGASFMFALTTVFQKSYFFLYQTQMVLQVLILSGTKHLDEHYFILGGKNLTLGEFIQFSDSYIVLEAGDKLEITPTSNDTPDIHAFCTVEETFIPVG
jgi:hypothetical protein